jgi:hypothetical protein
LNALLVQVPGFYIKEKFYLKNKKENSYGHSSSSNERTRDKCVPRFRCNDAQSIHIKAPRFKEAHVGSKNMKIKADLI